MENMQVKPYKLWLLTFVSLCLVGGVAYEGYILKNLTAEQQTLAQRVASSTQALQLYSFTTDKTIQKIEQKIVDLSDLLYEEQSKSDELSDDFRSFDKEVNKLTGTVKTLEKLTTTDPELLQKYSRIYFLNEHYKPADLTPITEKYDFVNGKEATIDSNVWPFLHDLLTNAEEDGITLLVLSGYRSFEEQATLKGVYTIQYGTGANQFSADQGYSEHQLGTTIDFTVPEIGEDLSKFNGTPAHQWLVKNAYKYGFIMSYPENNQYYVYEPWHWRFVGEDLARYLKRENKHFYDLEQRTIDGYITTLFD
jgi:LAS superfamily LD-carboxypeptidase LdcB